MHRYLKFTFLLVFSLLTQCATSTPVTSSSQSSKPKEYFHYSEKGFASWYGPGFHGRKTASGQIYNQHHYTAAHRTLPFHSKVRVTNIETGKSVIVHVNDRGPTYKKRIIDLSYAAARDLGAIKKGIIRVHVENLNQKNLKPTTTLKKKKFTRSIKMPHRRGRR